MRKYRLVLILKRGLDKKTTDGILSDVKKNGGEVKNDKVTDLGEKKFAYKIKKEQSGNYIVWEFESDKVSLDLEAKLRLNNEVLRHLLIRLD